VLFFPQYFLYRMPFFVINCCLLLSLGLSASSQYFFSVGSVFCFSFSSSGPMSRPGTDLIFRGFGGLFSLATMALVCTAAHCLGTLLVTNDCVFVLSCVSAVLSACLMLTSGYLSQLIVTLSLVCFISPLTCTMLS